MTPSTYLAAATLLLAATTNTHAQGLAEDFSSDLFSISSYTDNLGSPSDGISVAADGTSVSLRATTNNEDRAKIAFYSVRPDDVNEISVSTMLSGSTQFDTNVEGQAKFELEGYFYNDLQDNGLGDENRTGDTKITIAIAFRNDGSAYSYACFERRNADGSRSILPGVESTDGDNCTGFSSSPTLDLLHTLSIGYDKTNAKVYAVLDEERIEYAITTGHYSAQRASTELALRATGTSTVALGSIHSIQTNTYDVNDLSAYAGEPVYKSPSDDDDIAVVNGKLRLASESDGSSTNETNRAFRALGETDYIEALISLSSESNLSDTGFNIVRLRNTFYNEAQNGGIGNDGLGDATSDVFSSLNLSVNENREVMADVSIVRADSGDYSAFTFLSNDPDVQFPLLKTGLALDTEYLASIQLDRDASQLIFKFADAEYVYNIQTPIYTASFVDGAGIDSRIRGAGKTVAFADDFRTDPNAQTSEEQATNGGQTTGGTTENTSGGSSGGGGCSIGPAGSSTGFMLLMVLFVSLLRLQRYLRIQRKKC